MLELFQKTKILVVVAHPDDEVLGIGATIHRLSTEYESDIRVVILGEGLTSRADKRDTEKWKKELEKHKENIFAAKDILRYGSIGIYHFPDNRFDAVELLDIVKVVEKEKQIFVPDIIFTHHYGDLNIDHRRTFEAVITATRPMKHENVKAVVCFETPSATEWNYGGDSYFVPNFWIEIGEEDLKAKQIAMDAYEFESRKYPHPRSAKALKALAQKRGVEAGMSLAEAFFIARYNFK